MKKPSRAGRGAVGLAVFAERRDVEVVGLGDPAELVGVPVTHGASRSFARSRSVLLVADVLHPFDDLAVERLLDGDVRHRGLRPGAEHAEDLPPSTKRWTDNKVEARLFQYSEREKTRMGRRVFETSLNGSQQTTCGVFTLAG